MLAARLTAPNRLEIAQASGQIKLRKIDGLQKIAGMLNQHTAVAA